MTEARTSKNLACTTANPAQNHYVCRPATVTLHSDRKILAHRHVLSLDTQGAQPCAAAYMPPGPAARGLAAAAAAVPAAAAPLGSERPAACPGPDAARCGKDSDSVRLAGRYGISTSSSIGFWPAQARLTASVLEMNLKVET